MNNVVSIRWVVALKAEAKEIIDKLDAVLDTAAI